MSSSLEKFRKSINQEFESFKKKSAKASRIEAFNKAKEDIKKDLKKLGLEEAIKEIEKRKNITEMYQYLNSMVVSAKKLKKTFPKKKVDTAWDLLSLDKTTLHLNILELTRSSYIISNILRLLNVSLKDKRTINNEKIFKQIERALPQEDKRKILRPPSGTKLYELVKNLLKYKDYFIKFRNEFRDIFYFLSNFLKIINYPKGNYDKKQQARIKIEIHKSIESIKKIVDSLSKTKIVDIPILEKMKEIKDKLSNLNFVVFYLARACQILSKPISKIEKYIPRYELLRNLSLRQYESYPDYVNSTYKQFITKNDFNKVNVLLDNAIKSCENSLSYKSAKSEIEALKKDIEKKVQEKGVFQKISTIFKPKGKLTKEEFKKGIEAQKKRLKRWKRIKT